jgi:hypothetical protein
MGVLGRKAREKELEGVNLLGLAPVRFAAWEEEEDGRVILLRPKPTTGGLQGAMDRFFHRMSANRVRLDEVGSFAWLRLDGERTVAQVAELLEAAFGDRVDPVQERLAHLVWLLRREGFLGYPGWDEEG